MSQSTASSGPMTAEQRGLTGPRRLDAPDVHPPIPARLPFRFDWHQDGGRQNLEIETTPRHLP